MKKSLAVLIAAALTGISVASFSADAPVTNDPAAAASDGGISKDMAKGLRTQSDAQYKARGKVAEANEELNKGDCKTVLEGSAKRACEKSAKASARSDKADAKTLHEQQKQEINAAKK